MTRQQPKQSCVYFAQEELSGRIKIGWTRNLVQRRQRLRTDSPGPVIILGTLPGGSKTEKRLHHHFATYRRHGEWFEPHPALLRGIAQLLLLKGDQARTVLDELKRRNGCRFGLKGVLVARLSDARSVWVIISSEWDRHSSLTLSLVPEGVGSEPPYEGIVRGVLVSECVLFSDWPAPCPCWRI